MAIWKGNFSNFRHRARWKMTHIEVNILEKNVQIQWKRLTCILAGPITHIKLGKSIVFALLVLHPDSHYLDAFLPLALKSTELFMVWKWEREVPAEIAKSHFGDWGRKKGRAGGKEGLQLLACFHPGLVQWCLSHSFWNSASALWESSLGLVPSALLFTWRAPGLSGFLHSLARGGSVSSDCRY